MAICQYYITVLSLHSKPSQLIVSLTPPHVQRGTGVLSEIDVTYYDQERKGLMKLSSVAKLKFPCSLSDNYEIFTHVQGWRYGGAGGAWALQLCTEKYNIISFPGLGLHWATLPLVWSTALPRQHIVVSPRPHETKRIVCSHAV